MVTVSVVIPTYNRADVLPRAIDSVLEQTYEDFEVIVVDDGSEDETKEVITSYDDNRIRYISFDSNKGANAARNEGIRRSTGDVISFLDSDDELTNTYIEECVNELKSRDDSIGMVFTSYYKYRGEKLSDISNAPDGIISSADIRRRNIIGGFSCVTVRKSVFETVGLLDEDLKSSQDYDFFIRIIEEYDAIGIKEPLLKYYYSTDSISTDIEKKVAGQEKIEKKHGDLLSPERLATHHYSRALLSMKQGNRSDALPEFKKAIRLNPGKITQYYHYLFSIFGRSPFILSLVIKRKIKYILTILRNKI